MYKRIVLAHSLLSAEGIIFISIDENEFAQLKLLCDSIFGEESFIECIIWNKRVPKNDKGIGNIHEYIMLYAKKAEYKYKFMTLKDGLNKVYSLVNDCRKKKLPIKDTEEKLKALYKKEKFDRAITLYNSVDENYRIWGKINMSWPNGNTFGPRYNVLHPRTKRPVKVPDRGWRWNETTFNSVVDYTKPIERYDGSYLCGGIWFAKDEKIQPSSVKYLDDVNRMLLRSIISIKSDGSIELEKFFGKKSTFSYPKSVILIKTLIDSITYNKKRSYILDFFAGSGTTAQAVFELNKEDGGSRRVILCTNNESNICDEVTYPRAKTVITGIRADGSKYSDGLPANLKYYRTDFVPRDDEELSERLNEHIVEMIQLEHGVDIDGKEYIMVLTDAEMDDLEQHWDDYPNAKALYISQNVMMTTEQTQRFAGVEIHIIPDYYFKFELKEIGEIW